VSPSWSSLIYNSNRILYNDYPLSEPSRSVSAKPAREAEDVPRPADIAAYQDALQTERDGGVVNALTLYGDILRDYPESISTHRALLRTFEIMVASGASRAEMEAYFQPLASDQSALGTIGRNTASEVMRQAMIRYGDLDGAAVAYRALAVDPASTPDQQRFGWLQTALLASRARDTELYDEAAARVLAYGEDSNEADILAHDALRTETPQPQVPSVEDESVSTTELSASPNPFNPSTSIHYSLATAGFASVRVYNVSGQCVRTLVNGEMGIGKHTVVWDGRDATGRNVATGAYLVRLVTPTSAMTQRVLLLR